jgi:site-specific DNA recombinase
MRSVVAYCRSACEPDGGPAAVRGQARAIRDYSERRGLTLHAIYSDAGVSGVTLERPALQELITDCRAGKIGMVITKDADRLSRDTGQLIALLHIFATAGVHVEFSAGGRGCERFLEIILSAVAELEQVAARSKPTHKQSPPAA